MTAEELRSHIRRQPFQPFQVCLADGRRIPVVHHDFIMLSPNGRLANIYQPDNSYSTIDVLLALGVELAPPTETLVNPSSNRS